jgi:hypothetical protein
MAIALGLSAGVAVLEPAAHIDLSSAPAELDATYWRVASGVKSRVLAVVWNGNQHTAHFLFDFEDPLRLHDCGELGTVVPVSMISAFWEETLAGLDSIESVQAEHFVLLGTPPPKADDEVRAALAREPAREPLLSEAVAAAGESIETIRITPSAVRVGLWTILQDDLEERAARIGATFVPVPASARTADGCLRPEYSAGDASHANGAFGALMLGEIEAAVARAEVQQR